MLNSIAAMWYKIGEMTPTARQAYWAMLSQVASGAAAFLTSVIIIREVGLVEFGRFSIAALLVITVKNFAEGLIFAPMASIGPKLNQFSMVSYRGFVLLNAIMFFVLTSALIWTGFIFASRITGAGWLSMVALPVAFASAASGLSDFFRRQQFLIGAPARSFGLEALRYTLQLTLLIGIIFFSPELLSATSAVIIFGISAFASAGVGYALFGRWNLKQKMARAAWFRHWSFMRWMVPSVGFETVQAMFPFFYASAILGEAALGLVRVAQQITSLLNLPFNALMQVIPAFAATKMANEGIDTARKFLRRIGGGMAIATAGTGMVVVILSDQISVLLDISKRADFGFLLFLFMTVNFFNALRFPTMVLVNTVEQTWINLAASAIGALTSISVGITLINIYGDIGVPVAFVAVAAINWTILYLWHKHSYPNKRPRSGEDLKS